MTDDPGLQAAREEWLAEQREHALQRLEATIPPRYRSATLDQVTDKAIHAWVSTIAENAEQTPLRGPSLLLLGRTGTGKTHTASAALRGLAEKAPRVRILATTCADLYAALRPRHGVDSEEVFAKYAGAAVLLLDDLGAAKDSEWTEEINYRLINHRYDHELPTIATSNLVPRELGAIIGERVASRLTEMSTTVVLTGPDRRAA